MGKTAYIKNLETDDYVLFVIGPFSQWYPSTFKDEVGTTFNSAEQYMMYHKALLFGDTEIAQEILKAESPTEQKNLGRQVKGFDVTIWEANCKDIVSKGNYLKFSQNPDLWYVLKATQDKTIVEAADYDPVWGIKLGAYDPRAQDKAQWQGTNYLGECLMDVRKKFNDAGMKAPAPAQVAPEHYEWVFNSLPLRIPGQTDQLTTLKAMADHNGLGTSEMLTRVLNNKKDNRTLEVPGYNKSIQVTNYADFYAENSKGLMNIGFVNAQAIKPKTRPIKPGR